MRKISVIAPLLALAAGLSGFFLRKTELSSVIDGVTGLAERNAPITVGLAALSIAVVVAAAVFAAYMTAKYTSPRGYTAAFAPANGTSLAVFGILGAVWLVAVIKYALDIRTAGIFPTIEVYFSALSALSAVSVALFALFTGRAKPGGAGMFFSVVPSLFMCFWLILLYKQNASNPVLISYCYQSLAIIAAALSFYFNAGFVFNKPAPGKMLLSGLATVFFCSVVLADALALEIKAIYAVVAAISLIRSALLIKNLEFKSKEPPETK